MIKILAIFLLFNLNSCISAFDRGAKLTFSSNVIYLGKVNVGKKKIAKMIIRNVGEETLVIKDVKAGCQCTAIKLSRYSVPPKQKALLTVTFKADSISQASKEFNTPVVVNSNNVNLIDEFYITGSIVNNDVK